MMESPRSEVSLLLGTQAGGTVHALLLHGPARDSSTEDNLAILHALASETDQDPLVLLPDDIQAEDYEPHYEVRHGDAACRELHRIVNEPGTETAPSLIFIDFIPVLWPDDTGLRVTLNELLSDGVPPHLQIVVVTPSLEGLQVAAFDRRASISVALLLAEHPPVAAKRALSP